MPVSNSTAAAAEVVLRHAASTNISPGTPMFPRDLFDILIVSTNNNNTNNNSSNETAGTSTATTTVDITTTTTTTAAATTTPSHALKRKRRTSEDDDDDDDDSGEESDRECEAKIQQRSQKVKEHLEQVRKKHKMSHEQHQKHSVGGSSAQQQGASTTTTDIEEPKKTLAKEELSAKEDKKMKKLLSDDPNFVCCISRCLIKVPVSLNESPEKIYDRSSLKNWLEDHSMEPSTGKELKSCSFYVNVFAKTLLDDYKERVIKKGMKMINKWSRENRSMNCIEKLIDRCLELNNNLQTPLRRIELLSEKLKLFAKLQKPLVAMLKLKMDIAQTHESRGCDAQFYESLFDVMKIVNSTPELVIAPSDELEQFIKDCSAKILDKNRRVLNRAMLLEFVQYNTQLEDWERVQQFNTKIIETKDSVDSQELFNVTDKAFTDLIAHYENQRYLNQSLASKLIVEAIEWRQGEKVKTWAPVRERSDILASLRKAIELDNTNVESYPVMISLFPELSQGETETLSECSFMLSNLVNALASSTTGGNASNSSVKYERRLLSAIEKQNKDVDNDMLLSIRLKDMSQYKTGDKEVFSSFELCGFEWLLELEPSRTTGSGNVVVCRLKCISDYTIPVCVGVEVEVVVIEPDDASDMDQLFLIDKQTIHCDIDGEEDELDDEDCIPTGTFEKYCDKNDRSLVVSVSMKLKSVKY